MKLKEAEVVPEESPTHESQSNGEIEGAVRIIPGQTRTLGIQLEAHYGMEHPRDSTVVPWLTNYAADTLNRPKLGDDGKTAYQRLRGRPVRGIWVQFGSALTI